MFGYSPEVDSSLFILTALGYSPDVEPPSGGSKKVEPRPERPELLSAMFTQGKLKEEDFKGIGDHVTIKCKRAIKERHAPHTYPKRDAFPLTMTANNNVRFGAGRERKAHEIRWTHGWNEG